MATWPSEATLFNTAISGAEANPLMKAWLETDKQLVGAVAPVTLRISNGSITPTAASIIVDTEGGAAADTLSVIATSKMQDGAIISLRAADASRKVTVQHSTGAGGLATYDGKNVDLDTQWELLARNVGGKWLEIPGAWRAYDAIIPPDGITIKIVNGKLQVTFPSRYEIGEFYYFRHPTLKPGFQPCMGGVLEHTATLYPEAWAYLQTVEGRKLCKAEAEWQALTRATWATLADGTKVGWNGIGGAPFYAPNTSTGALRMPDLRGMYAEAAGCDSLGAGGVHGDGIRDITGTLAVAVDQVGNPVAAGYAGALYPGGKASSTGIVSVTTDNVPASMTHFDASRVVPTAPVNRPRAWGALACCYLGAPK